MLDSIPEKLQNLPPPENDIQYIIYAVAFVVVAIFLGGKFIDAKWGKPCVPPATAQGDMEKLVTLQITALKDVLGAQFKGLEDRVDDRLEMFQKTLQQNEEREEARLTEFQRQVENGFRTIHDRIDKHIEANGQTRS